MTNKGHKISKWLEPKEFMLLIESYKMIEFSEHALLHLSTQQRGLYNRQEIVEYIKCQEPIRVGIQQNLFYSPFYEFNRHTAIRIIIALRETKVFIVTFDYLDKDKIPRQR